MATRANKATDGNKKASGTKFCDGQLLKVELKYCTHCGSGDVTINGTAYKFALTPQDEDED